MPKVGCRLGAPATSQKHTESPLDRAWPSRNRIFVAERWPLPELSKSFQYWLREFAPTNCVGISTGARRSLSSRNRRACCIARRLPKSARSVTLTCGSTPGAGDQRQQRAQRVPAFSTNVVFQRRSQYCAISEWAEICQVSDDKCRPARGFGAGVVVALSPGCYRSRGRAGASSIGTGQQVVPGAGNVNHESLRPRLSL